MLYVIIEVIDDSPQKYASDNILHIIITNLIIYLFYYVIMKLHCGEYISKSSWVSLFLFAVVATTALFYFSKATSDFDLEPSESRRLNSSCYILEFFNKHDLWHGLSAAALFFLLTFNLNLDDDVQFKRRQYIPVF